MIFSLFSKVSFTVTDPIALIESYCFQHDFYDKYDAVKKKEIEHVNKIRARIKKNLLPKCLAIVKETEGLKLFASFEYDNRLDKFLDLDSQIRNDYIEEFNRNAIQRLLGYGIGLSKATKVLHTFHPEIVPMIDNPLQELYKKEVNPNWRKKEPGIFIDYYNNLRKGKNLQYLDEIFRELKKENLVLTKVRIFDILWWSLLKAKKLQEEQKGLTFSMIK